MKCKAKATHLPWRRRPLGRWMERGAAGERFVFRELFPHSTACQSRYLSASNRGTGEDRQHLLSKPNYLLSTKQEAEAAPSPPSPQPVVTHRYAHSHSLLVEFRPLRVTQEKKGDGGWLFIHTCICLVAVFFFFTNRCMEVKSSSVGLGRIVPDSLMMEEEWVRVGEGWEPWKPQKAPWWSLEEDHVLVWAATEAPRVNIWHLESN